MLITTNNQQPACNLTRFSPTSKLYVMENQQSEAGYPRAPELLHLFAGTCLFKPEKLPYTLRRGLRVLLIKDRQRPAFAVTGDQHGVADFEA
jgi:hypothetical protein